MKREAVEAIKTVATAAIGALIIIQFIIPTTVFGNSMEPNFSDRDYVVLYRQAYIGDRTPCRGDIIVFKSHLKDENGADKRLIKRVIAVAGDKIAVKDVKVYLNDEILEEDYLKDGVTNGEVRSITVPDGTVFCMGDNRLNSKDSRHREVGMVPEDEVMGKVVMRLLPVRKFGVIE